MIDSGSIETAEITQSNQGESTSNPDFTTAKPVDHKPIGDADQEKVGGNTSLVDDAKVTQTIADLESQCSPLASNAEAKTENIYAASEPPIKKSKSLLAKLRKGFHNYNTVDPEKIRDRYFSQEELLKLVAEAKIEIARRKTKEKALLGMPSEESVIDSATNIAETAHEEVGLTEQLKAIEHQILTFEEKAKKGDSKAKKELSFLMVDQKQLVDHLYETEKKRRDNMTHMTEKAFASVIIRLLTPIRKVLIKAWVSLNSPINQPLQTLRGGLIQKIEKTSVPREDGRVKRVSVAEQLLHIERATPEALAADITQLQSTQIYNRDNYAPAA